MGRAQIEKDQRLDSMIDAAQNPMNLSDARLLLVDDRREDVVLLKELFAHWGFANVDCVADPTLVLQSVADAPPDLMILNLQMRGLAGLDLLRLLEALSDGNTPVPVLVITEESGREAKRQAVEAGASDFLSRPFDPEEVRLRVSNLLETRFLQRQLDRYRAELDARVQERTQVLEETQLEIAERLAIAAEYRDDDTHRHAERIGHAAAVLGKRLGLAPTMLADLRRAAPLHDIGKIAIADAILLKPGRLTPEEFETIKTHTVIGARILSGSKSRLLQMAEEIALSHHERWDGTGYPRGLGGSAIPLTGRIVAVADVFDSLTHVRPYKEAWPMEKAAAAIVGAAGSHFDPEVVGAFASIEHARLVNPEELDVAASELPSYVTEPSRALRLEPVAQVQPLRAAGGRAG